MSALVLTFVSLTWLVLFHVSALPSVGTSRTYTMFVGRGSQFEGWPRQEQWISYEQLFELNRPVMKSSCGQFHVPLNSDEEIQTIFRETQNVAKESSIDPRFLLAIILQESNGCVRAPTTNNGVRNPGLMQDHNGSATCNENGNILSPCPAESIAQMIRDGAKGTPHGDGLLQCLLQAGDPNLLDIGLSNRGVALDPSVRYYRAARIYNSGRVSQDHDLGIGVGVRCYVSDLANRLVGWSNGPSRCCLDRGCSSEELPSNLPDNELTSDVSPMASPVNSTSTVQPIEKLAQSSISLSNDSIAVAAFVNSSSPQDEIGYTATVTKTVTAVLHLFTSTQFLQTTVTLNAPIQTTN